LQPKNEKVYLKDKAKFGIGAAVSYKDLFTDTVYQRILAEEFNQITCENEMKMRQIFVSKDKLYFGRADSIIDFATTHSIKVHGHALVWHSSIPKWLKEIDLDSSDFENVVKTYIQQTVTHFKGKVISWDVVNEAISDSADYLRNSLFRKKMGEDYIARCFQYARQADPNVKLFYNDYSHEIDSIKLKKILKLVNNLKSRNIPIDGIGLQMHTQIGIPAISQIKQTLEECAKTGLLIHISELDITVNGMVDSPGYLTSFEKDMKEAQKIRTYEIVKIFNGLPENQKFAITTWGVSDKSTWLRTFFHKKKEWPLLFDDNFERKECYYGFYDAIK